MHALRGRCPCVLIDTLGISGVVLVLSWCCRGAVLVSSQWWSDLAIGSVCTFVLDSDQRIRRKSLDY